MKTGQIFLTIMAVLLLTTLSGCEQAIEFLGLNESEQKVEEESTGICELAVTCCQEMDRTGSALTNKVEEAFAATQDGEAAGWPNHCPSWEARQERECKEFLDQTNSMAERLQSEHPSFDYDEHCVAQ